MLPCPWPSLMIPYHPYLVSETPDFRTDPPKPEFHVQSSNRDPPSKHFSQSISDDQVFVTNAWFRFAYRTRKSLPADDLHRYGVRSTDPIRCFSFQPVQRGASPAIPSHLPRVLLPQPPCPPGVDTYLALAAPYLTGIFWFHISRGYYDGGGTNSSCWMLTQCIHIMHIWVCQVQVRREFRYTLAYYSSVAKD
jgi:hypothetical protein